MWVSLRDWWRSRSTEANQSRLEAEMEEEMRFHMAMEAKHLVARGATPESATRRVKISFGGEEKFREEIRASMPLTWLSDLRADVLFALRSVRRSPAFTIFAVLALGIGIGANATAFGSIDAVAFRKLPVADPERLVAIYATQDDETLLNISYPNFELLRQRVPSVEDAAAFTERPASIDVNGSPLAVWSVHTSANYFTLLGIGAQHGKVFTPGDSRNRVALISNALWKTAYDSDARIVGRTISINGAPFVVAGVAPQSFRGTRLFTHDPAVWLPVGASGPGSEPVHQRFNVIARLDPAATLSRAASEMQMLADSLAREDPQANSGLRFTLLSNASPINPWLASRSRIELLGRLFLLGVCLVLLVACANVANLLLTRMSVRRQEIRTRVALGVPPSRLVRQLLTESFVLAFLGGLVAVVLAFFALEASGRLVPPIDFPTTFAPALDGRVLAFTAVVSLVSAIAFGLAPLFHLWSRELNPDRDNSSRAAGGSGSRFRAALVVVQVAISVVTLGLAGLFYRGLDSARAIDVGFETRNAVAFTLDPALSRAYAGKRAEELYDRVARELRSLPRVDAVTLATAIPLDGNTRSLRAYRADTPGNAVITDYFAVDSGFFSAIGIPLTGRAYSARDSLGPEPVVVNQTLARRLWGDSPPIGQSILLGGASARPAVVIGVSHSNVSRHLGDPPRPILWRPLGTGALGRLTIVARTSGDPKALRDQIVKTVGAIDPTIPVIGLRSLKDQVEIAYSGAQNAAFAGLVFGGLATLLAALGLFGALAYNVTLRTREIGIRRALGATSADVIKVVAGSTMRLTLIGIAIGVGVLLLVPRKASSVLYGVSPRDPGMLLIIAVAFLLVAVIAILGPAWKATRIDPAQALRNE